MTIHERKQAKIAALLLLIGVIVTSCIAAHDETPLQDKLQKMGSVRVEAKYRAAQALK